MSRVEIATLLVGARVKEGKRGGASLSLPPPLLPLTHPHFLLSFGVYTWRFHNQKHSHA